MHRYKYLWVVACLSVAFRLISDVTAGKIISFFGVGMSVTIIYFPITYILSDITTEVYGYARARAILWITAVCSVIAGLLYQIVVLIPPAPFFEANDAYTAVFGVVPRILLAGWLAVFAGDLVNNYVLAKMKVWTNGRFLWMRTIGSTVVGQGVDTTVFYLVGLYGVLPTDALVQAMVAGWALKVAFEAIMTPATYAACGFLKRREGVDHFDRDTNFTPFAFERDVENKKTKNLEE